jgi:hypothetical protein
MYSVVNNTWTWIHGVQAGDAAGVYGEKGVGTAETRPGARARASFAYDKTARKFYMFAGLGYGDSNERGVPSDLWLYEPDRNVWTFLAGNSDPEIRANYGTRGVT